MAPLESNVGVYQIDPPLQQNIINKAHLFKPEEDPTGNLSLRRKIADLEKIAFEAQIRANESDAEVINLNAQLDYVEQKHKNEKRILNKQLDKGKQKHKNEKESLNTQMHNLEQKHKVENQALNSKLNQAEKKHITENKEIEQKHKTEKNEMLASFNRTLEAEAKKIIMLNDECKKAIEATIAAEKKKITQIMNKHSDDNKNKLMRIHDLHSKIQDITGSKKVVHSKAKVDFTEEKYIELISKQVSDSEARISNLKAQLNSTEKKREVETQEHKGELERSTFEAQAVVMKLKAALEFTVRKKDDKIQELSVGFGEEKKKMIECHNAEITVLQNKNRDRKEIVSDKLENLLKIF
eukprot:CAMPEP_0194275912 /NCGR_PEP_ID=MMETSP0169-20130528/8624_1 /TAXON_ID=218684 /ORGANISM="Corethron pennatum, Strain L29A3" /LENGTH=352 /DNA_ID=CAMNT_0039019501 /DNA_START=139 /DNA_END=1197 /DNA_ORIENTATION=-